MLTGVSEKIKRGEYLLPVGDHPFPSPMIPSASLARILHLHLLIQASLTRSHKYKTPAGKSQRGFISLVELTGRRSNYFDGDLEVLISLGNERNH